MGRAASQTQVYWGCEEQQIRNTSYPVTGQGPGYPGMTRCATYKTVPVAQSVFVLLGDTQLTKEEGCLWPQLP